MLAASSPSAPRGPLSPPRGHGRGKMLLRASLCHKPPAHRCKILSPSAAFHGYRGVRPAAASPPVSSGAGEAERGSRREPSFIRNSIWLQPSLLTLGIRMGQRARSSAQEAGGELLQVPSLSPDFISQLIIGGGRTKPRRSAAGARAARPGSGPSPPRDGEAAERAASWRMEITLAAGRAGSCSGEGRKEAALPMDLRHSNNGRALSGHRCSSEHSLCKALLLSHPCWEYL